MKHVKIVFLLCTLFLALGVFAVQTGSGHEGKEEHQQGKARKAGMDMDELMKDLTAKLNLTADQQTKIRAILTEGHAQAQAISNDVSLSKEEKHSKMQANHDAMHAKVREQLTDDQKPKFDQFVQQMMQEHQHQGDHDKGEHNPK